MSKMNSVVHFELPYEDADRVTKFYQNAFGWQTQTVGEEMGNYVLATTTETDENGPNLRGQVQSMVAFLKKPTGRRNILHS
jgi:predicted enzyme related to lactoylglutathione lyase